MEQYQTIQAFLKCSITLSEACQRVKLSERQFFRLTARVKEAEKAGRDAVAVLGHGNRGRPSNRALSAETKTEIKKHITQHYADFGPTFAAEQLEEKHGITVSEETLRKLMSGWGYWKPKPRKRNGEHREWRERRSLFGEMQQFDGSYHSWFEDRAEPCCLLASIDDATGRLTGLKFVEWEGVFPSFAFWREYLEDHGKPGSIYLDKHSTYKVNSKHLLDDPEAYSQFERVCGELGMDIIHARSPQAKGRIERLFETLQDRLIKELRLAGISTREEADRYVRENFIPRFNDKFAVVPREEGDAHQPVAEDTATLDRIFSFRSERVVMNDFTVRYKNRFFQLLPTVKRLVRRKEKVEVREREDRTVTISLRGGVLPNEELPERPPKVRESVKAPRFNLPASKAHTPAADHPWRKQAVVGRKNRGAVLSG